MNNVSFKTFESNPPSPKRLNVLIFIAESHSVFETLSYFKSHLELLEKSKSTTNYAVLHMYIMATALQIKCSSLWIQ